MSIQTNPKEKSILGGLLSIAGAVISVLILGSKNSGNKS